MKGKRFMITKNDNLKALYADDLSHFLLNLQILEDFDSGKCKCRYCDAVITKENLYAIIPVDDHIEFSCKSPLCMIKMNQEAGK